MQFQLVNIILTHAIALYKQWRAANPNQPALTDAEIIEMLRVDSQAGLDQADAWLAAHPKV